MKNKKFLILISSILSIGLVSSCDNQQDHLKNQDSVPFERLIIGDHNPENNIGKMNDYFININTLDCFEMNNSWNLVGNLNYGVSENIIYQEYCKSETEYINKPGIWLNNLLEEKLSAKRAWLISFDSNGGNKINNEMIFDNEKIDMPPVPTKDGYNFVEWINSANNIQWNFNVDLVNENINLKAVWSEGYPYNKVIINEICSKNRYSFVDKYNEKSDWIELYNSSNIEIDLSECGLSDTKSNKYIFKFDNYKIEANSYLLVVASGRTQKYYKNECHLPFTLSQAKGGSIYFSSPYNIVDEIKYPALKDDISYGKINGEFSMLIPSPGKNNEEIYTEKQILKKPVFSKKSGFFDNDFQLTIEKDNNCEIYYTTDGSEPDKTSTKYTGPITITNATKNPNKICTKILDCIPITVTDSFQKYIPTDLVEKCSVIKAKAYDSEGNYSDVACESYFVGIKQNFPDNILFSSLSTDYDNLFDEDIGIYCNGKTYNEWCKSENYNPSLAVNKIPTNYNNSGFEWERKCSLNVVDCDGSPLLSQTIGMRIKGTTTRCSNKKSFNLYARYLYDQNNTFNYKFNGIKTDKICLRNGGNRYSYFLNDSLNSSLAEKFDLNITYQHSTPTFLFLNGEFWGLYFYTDAINDTYLEKTYDIENPILIKNNAIEEGYMTDISISNDFKSLESLDFTLDDNYKLFTDMVDLDSYIDYFIFITYIYESDIGYGNNFAFWKTRNFSNGSKYSDSKLRFVLFDTDGTYLNNAYLNNSFNKSDKIFVILKNLLKNSDFKDKFISKYNLLKPLFTSQETKDFISNYLYSLKDFLVKNDVRWLGLTEEKCNNIFISDTDQILNFFDKRPEVYDEQLKNAII